MTNQGDTPYLESACVMARAHELARAYVLGLPGRAIGRGPTPVEMAAALDEPLPDEPGDPVAAVAEWLARAEPGIVASAGLATARWSSAASPTRAPSPPGSRRPRGWR